MRQSQVRIMGANAASQDPEKTIVLIDLVPLGERIDNTTAYLIFDRFWHKQVLIRTSFFGDYDVLYVHYPGLPPSPPSAPSNENIIGSDPYTGNDNNGITRKPLGVDVRGRSHKDGLNRGVIAIIVLSASIAVILCCAIAWVLLFKNRDRVCQPDQPPPPTVPSFAKSSGAAASMIGSGPSSVSLSFGSSIAPYTGSAKTYSSSDIERATDNFNESRILGEGGFGRVYSGVLDDGTKVAVKVLKRDDQQGSREFLAEVEMLSRLHHRNLVKLIGTWYQRKVLFRFTSLARLGYEYWAFEKDGVGPGLRKGWHWLQVSRDLRKEWRWLPNLPVPDVGIGLPVRADIGSHVRGRVVARADIGSHVRGRVEE
ncbi:hypothetical protein LguiB_010439 [Lonicera macranthoides]